MPKLYIVSTPIGNLGDMTFRAVEVLKSADIIACEDTRVTRKLCTRFEIKTPLISYHDHSGEQKTQNLLSQLADGKNIALVTDAGTPIISDPGGELVRLAIGHGFEVEAIPGACAAITALTLSGLDASAATFFGFLPRDKRKKDFLLQVENCTNTIILYESPHRVAATLKTLAEITPAPNGRQILDEDSLCSARKIFAVVCRYYKKIFRRNAQNRPGKMSTVGCRGNNMGERKVAVCRELTKLHEQVLRTTLSDASQYFSENEPRGEFVLVIEGKQDTAVVVTDEIILSCAKKYLSAGLSASGAARQTASEIGVAKSRVYNLLVNISD